MDIIHEELCTSALESPLLVNVQASYGALASSTSDLAAKGGLSKSIPHDSPATSTLPSYSDATADVEGQRGREGVRKEGDTRHYTVFMNLRKFVMATLCILPPSPTPSQCQRNCGKYGSCFSHGW
jgi:hypothetical protein